MKSNYSSISSRIRSAKSVEACDKIELKMNRLWGAGIFTANEFMRLDGLLVDQRIKFQNH